MEVWKDIKGYKGFYQVSNLGRVRSLKKEFTFKNGGVRVFNEIILKPDISKLGYESVRLSKKSKVKAYKIHRLVAVHFIENFENKLEVNHIDGIKSNNTLDNLEWVTSSENKNHAFKIGLRSNFGEKNPLSKLTEEEVFFIKYLSNELSYSFLSNAFNVHHDTIRAIKKNRIWKTI
jgi:hypothetical protein